jgi:hypothetical protein
MGKGKDAHPKKEFSGILQTGLSALNQATAYEQALGARLPAGLLVELTADLHKLGADVPGAEATREAARAATATQEETLAQGYALVTAIRAAVLRSGAGKEVRKGYGVGAKTSAKVVKSVKAAISGIVERATAHPEEAQSLGILPRDVAALQEDLAAIAAADEKQDEQRAGAPQSTKERNRTANRVLEAVDRIVSAGVLEFAKDTGKRAEFESLASASASGGNGER